MASPAVTYSFTNGTTIDAGQFNTNFSDLIAGMTDGTKDFSISALTLAGAFTANGNVTLGNATTDTITTTGRAASSYVPSATASYDFGSSTLGWASLYLGRNSQTVRLIPSASTSATYTITLPTTAGTKGYVPYNSDSAGTLTWVPGQSANLAHSGGGYTVLDDDGYATITVTTSTTDRTITLPTASANSGRKICIVKADSDSGRVVIAGESAELVGKTVYLVGQYESAELYCDGTSWRYLSTKFEQRYFRASKSAGAGVKGSDGVVALGIDTIAVDPLNWFVESASTSAAYFKPNAPGYYLVSFTAGFASQPDNVEWSMYIQRADDGSTYATNAQITASGNGDDVVHCLSAIVYMDGDDDRLRVAVSNVNGTDVTTTATTRYFVQGHWLGA